LDRPKDILIIPRHKVVLRFVELPSVDPREIDSMMEYQVFKELPYQKEEITAGFRNIGSYKRGFSYIMLAVAKKRQVEEMIAQRGAKPENIRVDTELLYLYLLGKGMVKKGRVILFINIREDCLEVMVTDSVKPVFSRGLSSKDRWLEEINQSMLAYKRNGNKEIEELVIIYGSNLDLEDIESGIKEFFSVPVNFYEYKEDWESLCMPLEIDLLPREYIDRRLSRENARQALLTCFLLFITTAMLVSFFIFKIREKNMLISALSKKTERMQKDVDDLNTLLKKTELLECREEKGKHITAILKSCYGLVPQDISLAGLDYNEDGILYCKGMARYMPSVFNFVKVLEKSKYFRKVEVEYAAKKETGSQAFTDFSIACFIH